MCTTVVECDMTRVEERRRRLGLTALPLVARHTIDTLREFPALNATLDGSDYVRYTAVHLGIAVSLGEEGLIVPVIRDAQNLAEEGLANRIKDLASQARVDAGHPMTFVAGRSRTHKPRGVRRDDRNADHQRTSGRHPRSRGRSRATPERWRDRSRRIREHRD